MHRALVGTDKDVKAKVEDMTFTGSDWQDLEEAIAVLKPIKDS